jgi:hypothetical protein
VLFFRDSHYAHGMLNGVPWPVRLCSCFFPFLSIPQ